jgi:hypothetical protein
MYSKDVAPARRTFRTVFRDSFSSRAISLIVLPFTKCSRLIRPIVSTTNIPRHPLGIKAGQPAIVKTGSELDADYPSTGSIFHAGSQRPANRRFTPTAAAASIRVLPALTMATAIPRNSACVAGASLRKSRLIAIPVI